jgi:lysophospholipase L1-like esterase
MGVRGRADGTPAIAAGQRGDDAMKRILMGVSLALTLGCAGFQVRGEGLGARQAVAADPWEADIRKFEDQDKVSPPPQGGVVFIGSSSIVRWKLDEAFPGLGAQAINRGFGGSFMADAVRYIDRIVVPYKPRVVVLYEGDNDLTSEDTPAQIAAQFTTFLEHVHRGVPEARIVAIGVKPSIQRWALIEKARAINTLMRAACGARPYATFVDVERPMLSPDGQPRPELYVEDGLHMSPAGYAIWNRVIAPLVR